MDRWTRRASFLAALALTMLRLVSISAQEMPGKGMTCWDKRELCDLNCVFATTHDGTDGLTACSTGCMEEHESCEDSDETLAYISCATDCTYTYDSALTKCNQQVSDKTKNTYGANLDACANRASGVMDDCMEDCYGSDRFNGWTPQNEEGQEDLKLPGIDSEVWRHPFRSMNTIYGRVRGEKAN